MNYSETSLNIINDMHNRILNDIGVDTLKNIAYFKNIKFSPKSFNMKDFYFIEMYNPMSDNKEIFTCIGKSSVDGTFIRILDYFNNEGCLRYIQPQMLHNSKGEWHSYKEGFYFTYPVTHDKRESYIHMPDIFVMPLANIKQYLEEYQAYISKLHNKVNSKQYAAFINQTFIDYEKYFANKVNTNE